MENELAFDNLTGMLADFRENPSPAEKQNIFTVLSNLDPAELPAGLQAVAETMQISENEMTSEFQTFCKEYEKKIVPPGDGFNKNHLKEDGVLESRSDSGNSRRLIKKHGGILRFCYSMNCWLIWSGDRWTIDQDGEILQYARSAVKDIYAEAANLQDKAERKAHGAFALRSESEHALKAMVNLARSEYGIPIRREQLNAHPFKLNVLNGILDLKTGEIIDHDPGYYFSKILPIHFDSMETAPLWEKFLNEITGSDEALKIFLRQIAGYCLTASTREQCFFIFWGDGRNGKSTFIKILLELLGSWGAQTPAETFLLKKGSGGFSDLARLSDMRLVAAIETDEGGKLAEGLIKSLSGNDRVAARHHYQEFFEYEPQFKIILTTNHRPQVKGNDLAIWRRIRLVPFTWTIPDERVDLDLFEKLKTELPGILAWAVKGCFEWLNRGKLESPETVIEAVNDYKTEQDQVHRFIDDCCEHVADDDQESAKNLFDAYKAWSTENGEHYYSANRFGRRLQDLGFEKIHTMIGNAYKKIQLTGKVSNERF